MRKFAAGIASVAIGSFLCAAQDKGSAPPEPPKSAAKAALELAITDAAEIPIPVLDLERAKKFYEQLGCTTVSEAWNFVSMKGGGLRLRLVLSKEVTATDYPILLWRVTDLGEMKQRLRDSGFPGMEQPKSKTGWREVGESYGVGAWFNVMKDPDGHVLEFVQKG